MHQGNIINIPLYVNFLTSFSDWFIEKFANTRCTIIFSNQACIYDVKQNILQKTKFPPTIKAIDQLEISDLSNLININQESAKIISSLGKNKVLSKIASLFRLIEIIKEEQIFKQTNHNTTYFKIALDFLDIFYSLENEQINLDQLNQIDDSDLAEHRLITLEFIKKFYCKIKNHNFKENTLFAESFANHLRKTLSELIANHSLKQPLIIVGSSGSINSTLQLIYSIAQQQHGYVVLHGLSQQNFTKLPPENHPQYFLQRIIHQHNIKQNSIINLNNNANCNLAEIILQKLFLPAEQTLTWQKDEQLANFLTTKAQKNYLKIIECSNYFAEADFITQTIINNPSKKIGIVVYDGNFLPFLTLNLQQKNIVFNNKIAQQATQHELFSFISLLYQITNENLNPYTLSALLHHKLFVADLDLLYWLELFVLRQPIVAKNLTELVNFLSDDIYEKSFYHQQFIKNYPKFIPEILENIIDFLQKLINNLPKEPSLESYINSIEKITTKNFSEILNNEKDFAIKKFIEELISLNYKIQNLEELKCVLSNLTYFPTKSNHSNITILSNLEARLLSFDLLIIANANESFLPQTQDGGLIGNKIKTELNINLNQKRFGQSAFDFCSYFQQPQIFFTYSNINISGKINKISPFLLKFRVLIQKLANNLLDLIFVKHIVSKPSLPYQPIKKPEIQVSNTYKPKKFSVNDIYDLTSNPYCFYVKNILKLSPLSNFNSKINYLTKAKLTSDILNDYFKNQSFCPKIIAKKLQFYFLDAGDILLHQIWLTEILENANQKISADYQNHIAKTQQKIKFSQKYLENEIEFTAKIDLILSAGEENQLIQYQTKSTPDKAEKRDMIVNYRQFFYEKSHQNQATSTTAALWDLKNNNYFKAIKNNQKIPKELDLLMQQFLQEDYLFSYIKSATDHYKKFTRQEEWQCQTSEEEFVE